MDKTKLQEIKSRLDEDIRRAEYDKAFSEILKIFIEMRTANEKERSALMSLVQEKMQEMDQIDAEMKKSMSQMGKDMMKMCQSEMKRMEREQEKTMNFMRDKARQLENGRDGAKGEKGDKGDPGSPDTPNQILNKVQSLNEGERWDIQDVNGLEKELEKLRKMKTQGGFGGGNGLSVKNAVLVYDLSSSLNGVLKTFSLPAFWRVLTVDLSSFPNTLRPTTDYTTDGAAMTITFTSEIDAASSLATGQTCIITYVSA